MMKQTKAKNITQKVAKEVWERDGGCIICGSPNTDPAHYISKAHGGLGIKENIVALCRDHHEKYDSAKTDVTKAYMRHTVKAYLDSHYPDFTDEDRVYRK